MRTPQGREKELILFDLDGTLCVSKTPVDAEMFGLLKELLAKKPVAIISGGSYALFQKQLEPLMNNSRALMRRLFLFPTCGSVFYRYKKDAWTREYAEILTAKEREKIIAGFASAFGDIQYAHPKKLYGEVIEDRETQITFSALGQQAPPELKRKWRNENPQKREEIRVALAGYLPEFEIRFGGLTSIDVTHTGIDKSFGIRKIEEVLGFSREHMFFIGDDLGPNGNDYPVKKAGVNCQAVTGPEDTKEIIRRLLT